jgi:hypothetical protein
MSVESSGEEPGFSPEDVDRLKAELDRNEASKREIKDISDISFESWKGRPAADIIKEYGGLGELERRVGSHRAKELEEIAVQEETRDIDNHEGDK